MTRNALIAVTTAVIIVIAGAYLLIGHQSPSGDASQTTIQSSFTLRGVTLSPRSYSAADFTDFMNKTKQAGQLLSWYGDWVELSDPNGGPNVTAQLASVNGLEPLIVVTFFTQGTGHLLRPLNDSVKQDYIDGAVTFASAYKPNYLGFGIEINTLHESNPGNYSIFREFFPEVVAAVKVVSPRTKVFTSFNLERLRGLKGGLFGGVDDPLVNDWALLGDFPDADYLAFTTYPCLVYKDPSEMPAGYYADVRNHTEKPVIFTEAGWFSVGPPGWESSEEEEARFVDFYLGQAASLKPGLLIWSFLYDQNVKAPFDTMGLLARNETTSPAWEAWLRP